MQPAQITHLRGEESGDRNQKRHFKYLCEMIQETNAAVLKAVAFYARQGLILCKVTLVLFDCVCKNPMMWWTVSQLPQHKMYTVCLHWTNTSSVEVRC